MSEDTTDSSMDDTDSISYYYYAGLNNIRSSSIDSTDNERKHDAASLKKEMSVLSLGQLRNILGSLIDDTAKESETMTKITSLIGVEVDRLRNEAKHSAHWNDDFQHALEAQNNQQLSHLGEDFNFTANLYSQVLIAEKDLPDWKKTILPVNIGGFAGGTKYICHGIVFKFASDDRKIYGNQQYAAKAVAAELRHCSAIRESSGTKLAVPLGVSIDWLGHRLSATSLLPLRGRSSLVHGSSDAGKHIYFGEDDDDCLEVINTLSHSLGLATHLVRTGRNASNQDNNSNNTNGRLIAGPVDMEIHRTDDGRLYALDCHRLFPSESPVPSLRPSNHVWPKCGHLVRLLRPEFIQHYAYEKNIYFSSDAYSKFAHPSVQKVDDEKVETATKYLLTEVIPMFAHRLDQHWRERTGEVRTDSIHENHEDHEDHEDKEANLIDDLDPFDDEATKQDKKEHDMFDLLNTLSNDCHAVGINIRLLGHVRRASNHSVVRALLLVEMLARTAKITIRKELREISVKANELPSRSHFIQTVVKHLNLLLGCGNSSHDYWENILKRKLDEKYEFSTDGLASTEYLKTHLMVSLQTKDRRMMLMSLLWSRLKEALGIDVHPRTNSELMKEDSPFIPSIGTRDNDEFYDEADGVLIESEVLSITSRVKSPPVLSRAASKILLQRATEISRREHIQTTLPPLPSDIDSSTSFKHINNDVDNSTDPHTANWHASRLFRLASVKALQSLNRAPTSADSLSLLGETRLREAAQTINVRDSKLLLESANNVLSRAQLRASSPRTLLSPPGSPTLSTLSTLSNSSNSLDSPSSPSSSTLSKQNNQQRTGLRDRCALLGAVAKLRLACLGHKSLESKRQLLVEATNTLGSGLVQNWMEEEASAANATTSSSQSYPPKAFRFTNEINATSKIALEHLLALFHLGILESVDPFFVDSGIARLHKALAVTRMGGVIPLRETPIGSIIGEHIGDLLGLLLSPSCSPSTTTTAELSIPPPSIRIGSSVHPSCTVLLVHGTLDFNNSLPLSVVVCKDVVSIHSLDLQNNTAIAYQKGKKNDAHVICMTLMHKERILITANKQGKLNILDLKSNDFISRGKIVTGSDDEITTLAAHGETLAIGCSSGLIRVLTIVGGEYLNQETNLPVRFVSMLTGHSSKVMSLDLENNGQLISGGLDRSVRVWDLNSGQLLLSLTRRWPGWGPVYALSMLSAPLGTRCSIGEDTQGVAQAITLKRRLSTESVGKSSKSTSSNERNSTSSSKGKKKAIVVATGDGGLRVWSMSSLLSSDDNHRRQQQTPPACCRLLLAPRNEGELYGNSILPSSSSNGTVSIRTWSVCSQIVEIENTNCFVTGDSHGNVTIWCQLSWVKVMSFKTQLAISSLSVVRHKILEDEKKNEENLLILINGSEVSGVGNGQKTAILHTIKLQQVV